MKIHEKHLGRVAIGRRFRHLLSGRPVNPRVWTEFDAALRRRVKRVFLRVLSSGGVVVEFPGREYETAWKAGGGKFAPGYDTSEHIAKHVACRVCGFGWAVALQTGGKK